MGLPVDLHLTQYAGHATQLAREAYRKGTRKFLAAGGDGTSFEVLQGLVATVETGATHAFDPALRLGCLPLGTGNSLLRDLDFPVGSSARATLLAAMAADQHRPMDVIEATLGDGKFYYLNLLAIGFAAQAGDLANKRFKALGAHGYNLAVMTELFRLKPYRYELSFDGAAFIPIEATLLSFSNSRYTGGDMQMAPSASVSDGKLDLIQVAPMNALELVHAFSKIRSGGHVKLTKVFTRQLSRLEFSEPTRLAAMVDGEVIHCALKSLQVLPRALNVLTGRPS